jgi:hypothetical protein
VNFPNHLGRPPQVVTFTTRDGEVVTPEDLDQRIFNTCEMLEEDAVLLQDLTIQLGRATAVYQNAVDKGSSQSTARSSADRERDGRIYAQTVHLQGDPLSVDERKAKLEALVKGSRDYQHNLRSILSGLQTIRRSIGAVVGS